MIINIKKELVFSFFLHFIICVILGFYIYSNFSNENKIGSLETVMVFILDNKILKIKMDPQGLNSLSGIENKGFSDEKLEKPVEQLNIYPKNELGYLEFLQSQIEKHWNYPIDNNKDYEEVVVKFIIDNSGNLVSLELIKSSGNQEFDNSVINAISSSAPFLPFPEEWRIKSISINGKFVYDDRRLLMK